MELNKSSNSLEIPVQYLKGVGPRRSEAFEAVGIITLKDLLYYFPRKYLDRTSIQTIDSIAIDLEVNLIGKIKSLNLRKMKRGTFLTATLYDSTGSINLMWFRGVDYIKESLQEGEVITIHGKVVDYRGRFQIVHPEYDKLNENEVALSTGFVIPVYPLTEDLKNAGLTNRNMRKIIYQALESIDNINDHFSKKQLESFEICSLDKAIRNVHFTQDINESKEAIHRLKFDEHFFLQLLLALRKKKINEKIFDIIEFKTQKYNIILKNLSFNLTDSQKSVLREIIEDFLLEKPMNRMLQGDVGCGKTVVSILASSVVVDNDYQVAIMAPTDILARQLYKNFRDNFEKIGIESELLVGSLKTNDKKKVLKKINDGDAMIVIGTHALFQKDVSFKNLGFVIIDEQHRFGVNQRKRLLEKCKVPNLLAMTATPIPRTLAITYNGDMDLSIIDELPKNRPDIFTSQIQKNNLNTAYDFIIEKAKNNEQSIIVYPLIEETEKQDLEAANQSYLDLKDSVFRDYIVGLIHGKLDTDEKNAIMTKFMDNKIQVLISTTVIEVGIDNPNASVILINNCERFGLSQIHQLRGRVGRGLLTSYCILCSDSGAENTKQRLSILTQTRNGFEIADEDLKLRGPGEFFGEKQSGFIKFRIANLVTDGKIIRFARMKAFDMIDNDANLSKPVNKLIKERFNSEYLKLFLKTTVN